MAGRNWWLKNNYDVFYTIDMFRLLNSVETVCLLYHQKDKFISVPYEPKDDADDKVRMEAPEIFRVLGKRRPEFIRPYLEQLRGISETDENRVVRIHCLGAIKATESR